MKKYLSLLLILMLGFGFYVKADSGPPQLAKFKIVITNRDGAACYNFYDGKTKNGEVLPYDKEVYAYYDIFSQYDYIDVYYNLTDGTKKSCYVSVKDIAPKDGKFGVNNEDVKKITPVKAVILANGGLNLRKGPSTLFGIVTTIKYGTVVTLTHRAGVYWYYTNYNGNTGWITGENGYFGYDDDRVIYSYDNIDIYDKVNHTKIGTIPKLTEITDYLDLPSRNDTSEEGKYYVNYKGITGVISSVPFKTEGKIKLNKDVKTNNGKTLTKATYDYTIRHCYENDEVDEVTGDLLGIATRCNFYIPSVDGTISLIENDGYTISNEKVAKKTNGYIGEWSYGEITDNKEDTPTIDEPVGKIKEKDNKEFKFDTEMIIICVMGVIILGLTAFIIIKFANVNKKEKVQKQEVKKEEKKKIEPEKKEE